jgi:hypothetical protein
MKKAAANISCLELEIPRNFREAVSLILSSGMEQHLQWVYFVSYT